MASFTRSTHENKAFCRGAGVKFVPSGHIYQNGALVAALPLVSRTSDAHETRRGAEILNSYLTAVAQHTLNSMRARVWFVSPAQGKKSWDAFQDKLDEVRKTL